MRKGIDVANAIARSVKAAKLRASDQRSLAAKPAVAFDRSNIAIAEYRPEGYYRLFCFHGRGLWQTCAARGCQRDAREATANSLRLFGTKI